MSIRNFTTNLGKYRKFTTALVGVIASWATLVVVSKSDPITAYEWVTGGILLATALGVYEVPNDK